MTAKRGRKPGCKKSGGRKAGVKNKTTVAREKAVEEILAGVPMSKSTDAVKRMEHALKHLPEWSPQVLEICKALAPYQHAKKSEIKADINVPSLSDFVREREGK